MKVQEKRFAIFDGNRLKGMLLGNGINWAFDGLKWDQFLNAIEDKDIFPLNADYYHLPMSLKAALLSKTQLVQT